MAPNYSPELEFSNAEKPSSQMLLVQPRAKLTSEKIGPPDSGTTCPLKLTLQSLYSRINPAQIFWFLIKVLSSGQIFSVEPGAAFLLCLCCFCKKN